MRRACSQRWRRVLEARDLRSHDVPAVALTEEQLCSVREIMDRVLPGAEAWIFGSRATGCARPFSDLDLLLTQPRSLSWLQRADLRDAFEASDLPFKVDVIEADGLWAGFSERVNAERVLLRMAHLRG